MTYLLGKMIFCLLLAGLLGGFIGWFLKRIFAAKHHEAQMNRFAAERNLFDEELQRVKNNWHSKYSRLDDENNKIQSLLSARQQDNTVLAQSIKNCQQQRNEMKEELNTLRAEYAKMITLKRELESKMGD